MTRVGKLLLAGWLVVFVGVLGLVLGVLLYARLIVGVDVYNQPGILSLPDQMRVLTWTEDDADITLQSDVDVRVPFRHDSLELPLQGRYRAHLELDTEIPLTMTVPFTEEVNVNTELELDADTQLVVDWLPGLPLRGTIPINIDVPVSLEIPIQTNLRLIHDGEITLEIDQTLVTAVDEQLQTRVTLDEEASTPVENAFHGLIVPQTDTVPMVIDRASFRLPLETLRFFPVTEER